MKNVPLVLKSFKKFNETYPKSELRIIGFIRNFYLFYNFKIRS